MSRKKACRFPNADPYFGTTCWFWIGPVRTGIRAIDGLLPGREPRRNDGPFSSLPSSTLAILFPLRSLVSQHEQFRHFPCVAVLSTLGNHVSVSDALAYYWTFDAGTGVRHGKHTSDKLRRLF